MAEVMLDFCKRLQIPEYIEDLDYCCDQPLPWVEFSQKVVLISGATGMIGTFLVDVLMRKNEQGLDCKVVALGRSREKAAARLPYFERDEFQFIEANINARDFALKESVDFVIHLASTTHPVAYANEPVDTIESNIMGLSNLLGCLASQERAKEGRALFASSVEVYGENRCDTELFDEKYSGYIDCNTLRAGYTESKRLGEAMCQAYIKQYGLDIIIPRLPRTYGPTMLWSDTKAISQFIKNGIQGEDIVLKSKGDQLYSYLYVADTVSAILWCLLEGSSGEAYNAADWRSDITLAKLASCVAGVSGTEVVFDLPDATEAAGYSKATKALMNADKLKALGWTAGFDIGEGVKRTMSILTQQICGYSHLS